MIDTNAHVLRQDTNNHHGFVREGASRGQDSASTSAQMFNGP